MNKSELITDFINKIAAGDDSAKDAFSAYCSMKATSINAKDTILENFEQFKTALMEEIGQYNKAHAGPTNTPAEDPLDIQGDKIFINKKLIGRIHVDMDRWDSGIDFISADGSFSKEFDTAEELFAFISKKFLGESQA